MARRPSFVRRLFVGNIHRVSDLTFVQIKGLLILNTRERGQNVENMDASLPVVNENNIVLHFPFLVPFWAIKGIGFFI